MEDLRHVTTVDFPYRYFSPEVGHLTPGMSSRRFALGRCSKTPSRRTLTPSSEPHILAVKYFQLSIERVVVPATERAVLVTPKPEGSARDRSASASRANLGMQ